MRTPKWSSAAVAISTMASESTSRSSMKLLVGVTSPTGTPAISFTIVASPLRMSCWVMCGAPLRENGLWDADDLAGEGETRAECEQQSGLAASYLTGRDKTRKRERYRRG